MTRPQLNDTITISQQDENHNVFAQVKPIAGFAGDFDGGASATTGMRCTVRREELHRFPAGAKVLFHGERYTISVPARETARDAAYVTFVMVTQAKNPLAKRDATDS